MLIKEFIAQNPTAKENPLKYAVESKMREKHWTNSEKADMENSILLQDFVEEVNELVVEINNYEETLPVDNLQEKT